MSLDLSIYLFVDEEVRTRDWGISMADITSCSPDSKVKRGQRITPRVKSLSHTTPNEPFLEDLIGKVKV